MDGLGEVTREERLKEDRRVVGLSVEVCTEQIMNRATPPRTRGNKVNGRILQPTKNEMKRYRSSTRLSPWSRSGASRSQDEEKSKEERDPWRLHWHMRRVGSLQTDGDRFVVSDRPVFPSDGEEDLVCLMTYRNHSGALLNPRSRMRGFISRFTQQNAFPLWIFSSCRLVRSGEMSILSHPSSSGRHEASQATSLLVRAHDRL